MKITKDDVLKVADIALITVDDQKAQQLADEFAEFLQFANQLNDVDVSDVSPAQHITDMQNVFREDEVKCSFKREDILKNAPSAEAGCFTVPLVVE